PGRRADLPPAQDFAGKEIPQAHTDAIGAALVELAPTEPFRNEPDLFYVHLFDVALGTGLRIGKLRALRFGGRRPRAAADPRRARLLPPRVEAAENRRRRPGRAALPQRRCRAARARSA